MALVSLSPKGGYEPLVLCGKILNRGESVSLGALDSLLLLGDSKLEINFEESDREEIMQLPTDMFPLLSRVLGEEITTHVKIANKVLPAKKPAKKKSAPKAKKSSLTNE